MSAEANHSVVYSTVLDQLHEWHDEMRAQHTRPHPVSGPKARAIYLSARSEVFDVFPSIGQALQVLLHDNELVFADSPRSPNTPFARWYVDVQTLERVLMRESLTQAQNTREIPDQLRDKLAPALMQVESLAAPQPPQLQPEVIDYLAQLPIDLFTWNRLTGALPAWYTLLKRTLASKYYHKHYISIGYNRRAIQLCDARLAHFDILAGTAWQVSRYPGEYAGRFSQDAWDFIQDIKLAEHLAPGKMYSDEFALDDNAGKWETALETGVLPEKMTAQLQSFEEPL